MFCKIANLWDIDLKFSDVNIINPAKVREVSIPRHCISKNCFFFRFWCVVYRSDKLFHFFFDFVTTYAYLCIPTPGKNFIVIPFTVPKTQCEKWFFFHDSEFSTKKKLLDLFKKKSRCELIYREIYFYQIYKEFLYDL